MVGITIEMGLPLAVSLALLEAVWICWDAKRRGMDTADMWTVGFFVAFFLLPLFGGLFVLLVYLQKRTPRRNYPTAVPAE
ncbi:hypothetical protein ACNS7O_14100 [Haloferacaceae archaeon DSL9]